MSRVESQDSGAKYLYASNMSSEISKGLEYGKGIMLVLNKYTAQQEEQEEEEEEEEVGDVEETEYMVNWSFLFHSFIYTLIIIARRMAR